MKKNEPVRTESCVCKTCGCNFLAVTNTKEYELRACYRCFLSGIAEETEHHED